MSPWWPKWFQEQRKRMNRDRSRPKSKNPTEPRSALPVPKKPPPPRSLPSVAASLPHWRIGVFVDVQNLYHTTKTLWPGTKVNYGALRDYILERSPNPRLVTFHAFTAINPEWKSQEQFLWALSQLGYRVITKPIRRMSDGSIKGDMDLDLALEVVYMAPYLDEIVLVTGDGDFVPLVHQLVWMGKVVRVIGPGRLTAQELGLVAHGFITLDQIEGVLVDEDAEIPLENASG